MLCGEVDRRDEVIRRLQGERTAFVERIKSLDATMALIDSRLNPAAGGMVRATAGRYGPRGGLIRFVLAQLVAAGPAGLDSRSIRERASVHLTSRSTPLRKGTASGTPWAGPSETCSNES